MNIIADWWPLIAAAVDWVAVAKHWRRVEWVAKPAALAAISVWLAARGAATGRWPPPLGFFLAGLILSLIGDVLLMLPERYFLGGLAAFLLGHVSYVASFLAEGWPQGAAWLLAMPVAVAGAGLGLALSRRMRAGAHARLVGPVLAYTGVISLMVFSALTTLTRPDWPTSAAVLSSLGAGLFMVSDAVLAWRRFVAPMPAGAMIVIVTYHIGQMCLAAGAAGRWLA